MVTDDAGVSWRYRADGDASHVERYENAEPNSVIAEVGR